MESKVLYTEEIFHSIPRDSWLLQIKNGLVLSDQNDSSGLPQDMILQETGDNLVDPLELIPHENGSLQYQNQSSISIQNTK